MARPKTPNIKQFMDATGASASVAGDLLYGSVGSNVDIRNWDAIMASSDPVEAARAATRQMYDSGVNTNVNQPGSFQLNNAPDQVGKATGKSSVKKTDRFLEFRDASGNLLSRGSMAELTSPNRDSQAANIQSLLNRGVRLSDIQSALPSVNFAELEFSETPDYSNSLLRSDAASLAAERRARALDRQPIENFGYAQKTAETLGRQIGSIQDNISRGFTGGDTRQQELLARYAQEAAALAQYGFIIDPATGQLMRQPSGPPLSFSAQAAAQAAPQPFSAQPVAPPPTAGLPSLLSQTDFQPINMVPTGVRPVAGPETGVVQPGEELMMNQQNSAFPFSYVPRSFI